MHHFMATVELAKLGFGVLQLGFHQIEGTLYTLCDGIYNVSVINSSRKIQSSAYLTRSPGVMPLALLLATAKNS